MGAFFDTPRPQPLPGPFPAFPDADDETGQQLAQAIVTKKPARTALERAQVVYGETAGLYPRSIDETRSPYPPDNWSPGTDETLARARHYMAIVAGRNQEAKRALPNHKNPIEKRAWDHAVEAGIKAQADADILDRRITNFYIRGEEDQKEPWPEKRHYLRMGPFRSVGGGDAGRSNFVFIDFYGRR